MVLLFHNVLLTEMLQSCNPLHHRRLILSLEVCQLKWRSSAVTHLKEVLASDECDETEHVLAFLGVLDVTNTRLE